MIGQTISHYPAVLRQAQEQRDAKKRTKLFEKLGEGGVVVVDFLLVISYDR